ncbi:unnamed protein product, partial [Rhizoctonia solani]
MPGGDPLWYCHACNAEMRPTVMSPEPLCASCESSFIEQLPGSNEPDDDPRAFNAMGRLFEQATMARERGGEPHSIGLAIDPVGQLLGAVLGMRNLGPETPPRGSPRSTSPEQGPRNTSRQSTVHITRNSWTREGGGTRSSMRFSSGDDGGSGSGSGFFGFGRREERHEPAGLEEMLAGLMAEGPNTNQGGNRERAPPMLQQMLMGLLGAGIAQPGIGAGSGGNGRWGDYVLNQDALDQIITQLMDANHSVPVPVPEDMISSWPRTIITPDNPLEDQDCA